MSSNRTDSNLAWLERRKMIVTNRPVHKLKNQEIQRILTRVRDNRM